MRNLSRMHKRTNLLVLAGLVSLSGCITAPSTAPIECPAAAKLAPAKTTALLTLMSDQRLSACERDRSCDRVHFMQGLFTLSENPTAAAAHFHEVIRLAPKSRPAQLSRSWLTVLDAPSSPVENKVASETTTWLVDLLHRDKTIEELSKQLNALKLVDLEMKARSPLLRPRLEVPPGTEKSP
jgi:hypothetical protein